MSKELLWEMEVMGRHVGKTLLEVGVVLEDY